MSNRLPTVLLLVSLASLIQVLPSPASPVRIFFDTDMHTDCDDAGALAVLQDCHCL